MNSNEVRPILTALYRAYRDCRANIPVSDVSQEDAKEAVKLRQDALKLLAKFEQEKNMPPEERAKALLDSFLQEWNEIDDNTPADPPWIPPRWWMAMEALAIKVRATKNILHEK